MLFDSCQLGPACPCPSTQLQQFYHQIRLPSTICDDTLLIRLPDDATSTISTVALFDLTLATTGGLLQPKFLVEVPDFYNLSFCYDAGFLIVSTTDCVSYDLRSCTPYTGSVVNPPSLLLWKGPSSSFSLCGRLACVFHRLNETDALIYDLDERKLLCALPHVNYACWIDSTQLLLESSSCVFHVDLLRTSVRQPLVAAPTASFVQFGLMTRKPVKGVKATPCLYRAHSDRLREEICSLFQVPSFDALHRHELKLSSVYSSRLLSALTDISVP